MHRLPSLEKAEVKMLLNGPESFTADGSFLLGETADTKGLFLGCGMNSIGVATAGGAGMALAHCIQNGSTPKNLNIKSKTFLMFCITPSKIKLIQTKTTNKHLIK